jgi:adenylate cyclase
MVEATSRGIALAPNDAYVRAVHGIALRTLKQYKTAAAEAKQAYALAPNDPDVLVAVAVILLGVGDYDKTVETIRKAWALDPYINPLAIGVIMSQALFALGEFEESKDAALFCLQRAASDVRCQESLVRILGETGPDTEAREAADKLLRLSPGYTVSEYKRRAKKNRNDPKAIDRWADGLRKAGVPD